MNDTTVAFKTVTHKKSVEQSTANLYFKPEFTFMKYFFGIIALVLSTSLFGQNRSVSGGADDTLGQKLVSRQSQLYTTQFDFEIGDYTFSVKRQKRLDSLFFKTPDERLHFFMVDTAEEETYTGAPAVKKVIIPIEPMYLDVPRQDGQNAIRDTATKIALESRFVFQVNSVHDFFNQMKWLDEFNEAYPDYRINVFKLTDAGTLNRLGAYTVHQAEANLVSYLFKSEEESWFVLKFYRPNVHFKEPNLDMILHYRPALQD